MDEMIRTMGNNAEALTRESRDYLQAGVDYLYKQFVDTVARNRGFSVETVLEDMAEGRLFIGQQAIDAGLVDSPGSCRYDYVDCPGAAETRKIYEY